MASYRAFTAGATTTPAGQSPGTRASARDATPASRGQGLTRAALYARVSTDKQEREETIASQVDWLQQTAQARGYEVLPGNLFIDDGVSGTRLDRPALERLRDLAAEGAFEVVLVTAPDRLACRYAYQVVLVDELTRVGSRCVPRVAPHVRWCRGPCRCGRGSMVPYLTRHRPRRATSPRGTACAACNMDREGQGGEYA